MKKLNLFKSIQLTNLSLLLLVVLFTIVSCDKKPVSKYQGKWQLISFTNPETGATEIINDSTQLFLIINESESKKEFSDNSISFNTIKIKGNWIENKDSNTLKIIFVDPNTPYYIDSTFVKVDENGEANVILKENGRTVVETKNGKTIVAPIDIQFSILKSTSTELQLYHNEMGIYVYKKVEVKDTSFSLINIIRGIIGLIFFLFIAWLFSLDRKAIDWNLVAKGMVLQIVIAILVLKFPIVETLFDVISQGFVAVIGFTDSGIEFLFGQMGVGKVQPPLITFAVKVLPTIIFFSALVSLFYYWGILQKVVYVFAWIMKKFMRLSGAESLAAAGNVFLGQTEAPLLVKPYLLGMTKSEVMCLMTGGMATIAGGVLAAYVGFLGGDNPEERAFFAKHLLTASIMSAPAAIVAAKILVPEKEKINENLSISKDKIGVNALEAISNGTTDGLKLAVNVGAMLLVFTALMALGNGGLEKIGEWTGLNEKIASGGVYTSLSFEYILGNVCRPVVWMMGVDWKDTLFVGELLGTKTVLNEFIAYPRLGELKEAGLLTDRSVIISTYMLCGFANFASIGIQIGGIGALMPSRKGLLSQLGLIALLGGTIACILTAVVVGMMY
jgi:CNT family concentrative nucleoside transporter